MKLLEINHCNKKFGDNEVLKDISLSVEEGQVVSIIGPSGSGKSTLLRCATLLETMDGGDLIYLGEYTAKADETGKSIYGTKAELQKARQHFGLVFQNFNLFPHYSVLKNITEPPILIGKRPKDEVYAEARELLKKMGLADKEDAYPYQLSGGQQQRVAIARAVVTNPKLILADEPTGNLDSKNGAEVMNLLTELNKEGTTIIMVTHSQHDASFAHRTIHLFDGSVVASVAAQDL